MKIQKPHRATRSYVQHLKSSPAEVFPLLCPVREADWIEGWLPLSVISETGLAENFPGGSDGFSHHLTISLCLGVVE